MVNSSHNSMTSAMTGFHIVNFPYLSSNIPESPTYRVFVSKVIRYARVC